MTNPYEQYFNIDQARVLLKNPVFSNKYIVFFSGAGEKSRLLFNENFGKLVNTVSMPTQTFNGKLQYMGGISIVIPNAYEQGQLDMTMYNIGDNYKIIKQWSELHYNQARRFYGYVNDYVANIKILEFDHQTHKILEHQFEGCTLYTWGGINLSYEEASQFEQIQVSIQYRAHSVS